MWAQAVINPENNRFLGFISAPNIPELQKTARRLKVRRYGIVFKKEGNRGALRKKRKARNITFYT